MESDHCALCRRKRKLQYSHILPEFYYKRLYDPKHRFHVISINPNQKEHYAQKGYREYLLCRECEQKLSRWETYSRGVIFGGIEKSIVLKDDHLEIGDLKYNEFKLFNLSLLWRMGISKLSIFSEVQLGPHEEVLRKCLLQEDPLRTLDYPCVVTVVKLDNKYREGWMSQPERIRIKGHKGQPRGSPAYRILICGIIYAFIVSSHDLPKALEEEVFINTSGKMKMFIKEAQDIPYLKTHIQKLGRVINECNQR